MSYPDLHPDLDRLRSRLAGVDGPGADERHVGDEGALADPLPALGRTPAAVLVPIVLREAAPTLLLTRRTDHLKDHPGQISFPGGRVEPEDVSPLATALREAREEIGLDPALVEPLGRLPDYLTSTGFRVTPVVGLLRPPFDLAPDAGEVAQIFEVPLAFLLDPANRQRHAREWQGRLRHYYALPYGEHYIWGATAGMIVTLAEILA